jgi:MFS family permease
VALAATRAHHRRSVNDAPVTDAPSPPSSAFSPLKNAVFRAVWIGNLCAGLGTWLQNTGAGWLMTDLAPEPAMVAAVQAATLLPVFLFALPAGALADIIDRRLFLIVSMAVQAVAALALAGLTLAGLTGPWLLLFFTFLIGAGNAMSMPAWAATTPELVSREELPQAIALHGMAFNGARAVGPAIGGVVLATLGAWACFAVNAISYIPLIGAFAAWKRDAANVPSREHFLSAVRAGLRYVGSTPPFQRLMIRAALLFTFASAPWALLPLIVRTQLASGPETFGLLLGAMGVGAVLGGFLMPQIRARMRPDWVVAAGGLLASAGILALGLGRHPAVAAAGMFAYGIVWITAIATLQVAAQLSLPTWVRARALSIYQVAFFGALSGGSLLWGWAGEVWGIGPAMAAAAAGGAVAALIGLRVRLPTADAASALPAGPALAVPLPRAAMTASAERGPVVVTIRYVVPKEKTRSFLTLMEEVGRCRRRDGAFAWRVLEDMQVEGQWLEMFGLERWGDYPRHAARLTAAEAALLDRVASLHQAETPPETHLYLGPTAWRG